jgi:uncharacterized membrane protein
MHQDSSRHAKAELSEKKTFHIYGNSKRAFIQRLILALDFFVAADLLHLVYASEISEIIPLALIVAIRIALNWSLNKEIHLHKE